MVRKGKHPANQCSNGKDNETYGNLKIKCGYIYLNGIKQSQFTTLWVVEVRGPLVQRLETVHQTVIETIGGGCDEQ